MEKLPCEDTLQKYHQLWAQISFQMKVAWLVTPRDFETRHLLESFEGGLGLD